MRLCGRVLSGLALTSLLLSFLPGYFAQCPSDARWRYNNNNDQCYFPFPSVNTWTWCESTCATNSMTMLCVEDYNQNEFVLTNFLSTSSYIPVGLRDENMNYMYSWTSGCMSSYNPWAYDEPSHSPNEYCIYTSNDGFTNRKCDNNGASDITCVCQISSALTTEVEPQAPMDPGAMINLCPNDWVYEPDSATCFYFDRTPDSWEWCNAFCTANSVTMPCVMNQMQNDFLRNQIVQLDFDGIMLGYTDMYEEGEYYWDGAFACASTYTNWLQNGEPFSEFRKNCAILRTTYGNFWETSICTTLLNSDDVCACQGALNSVPAVMNAVSAPEVRCPEGWELDRDADKCYYIIPAVTSWDWCQATCSANTVSMINIENMFDQSFLQNMKVASGNDIFPLGLQRDGPSSPFGWWDEHYYNSGWGTNSPNANTTADCAYLWYGGYGWENAACSGIADVTCVCEAAGTEAPATMVSIPDPNAALSCPAGWEYYATDGKCYYVEETVRTWVSCRTFCAVNNVSMLCVENFGQNTFLADLKDSYGATINFPLGLSDPNMDGTYTWQSGCTSTYADWNANEPSGNGESCAFLWTADYGWNDVRCDFYYGSLDDTLCACESTPAKAPLAMNASNPCPPGWEYFMDSDKCYYVNSAYPAVDDSWSTCNSFCANNSVTMPCVQNAEENDFLNSLRQVSGSLYPLGLSDPQHDGSFEWTAGCTATYENWLPNEPNHGANEHCAYLWADGDQWKDEVCGHVTNNFQCVCEAPPATAPAQMVYPSGPCPAGWEKYEADAKCYYLPEYASYSWNQCEDFCDANGVDMICAENAGQANFVRGVVGNSWVALGLKDNVGDGSYAWNAGCSSAYIAWANGEPTGGDELCAAIAPDGFADSYCSQPLEFFRCGCESTPSLAPVTMVGELRPALPSMLSSATYVVRNGFAFAALANDSTVHTWGEASTGGNSSAVQPSLQAGVVGIAHSRFAFVALAVDGSVYGWGDKYAFVNSPTIDTIVLLVGNEGAFASRSDTSRGVAFGSPHSGGVIPAAYGELLASPKLRALAASSTAFAALMSDSKVFAWGSKHAGGGDDLNPVPNLNNVVKVVANREAFAAIDSFGGVTTWGVALAGGDSSSVAGALTQVVHIVGTRAAFAAFRADGGLVAWGYGRDGGDASAVSSSLASGVVAVANTYTAMAALKADGTTVTWGRDTDGGDSSGVSLTNLVSIVGNSKAFAAITTTGGVVAWGRAAYGGMIPADKLTALSSGVVALFHTDRAFAALKLNGALVVWGQAGHGGSPGSTVEALLTAGIHTVCANDAAFSAINAAGEVIAWGHAVVVPVPGVVYQSNSLKKFAKCSAEVGGAVRNGGGGGSGGGGGGLQRV